MNVEHRIDVNARAGLALTAPGSATSDALHAWSATALLAGFRRGEFSPVDVLRSTLARIEQCEPHLNALWAMDPGVALSQAQASEARWVQARRGGGKAHLPFALDGVPVTIKENIATRGVAVPLGCAATVLTPAARDAPVAARLREAGAVFLGKTTMPDWGMLSSGLSSFHALARNPWDPTKTPGGSSAGAGAACAAGYGPLHVGTDIGGSIRLPATWCGVVGFKPSLGRVPIDPPYAARVAGPMTRTVPDAALMMGVLSQPDARDAMSLPYQALEWHGVETTTPAVFRGLRVGVWLNAGAGLPLDGRLRRVVEEAAAQMQRAGAIVEPLAVEPFLTPSMLDGIDRFWRVRSWLDYKRLGQAQRDTVLPYIRAWIEPGAHASAESLFDGYSQMAALRDATVRATTDYDVVLSPVSPCLAAPAEWASPTNDPDRALEHIAYTVAFSMSEQPAVAVPWGTVRALDDVDANPMPVGVQIAARRHDDLTALRVANALMTLNQP